MSGLDDRADAIAGMVLLVASVIVAFAIRAFVRVLRHTEWPAT